MAVVESVEVRAANLRARVLEDMARVEEIGRELEVFDEEIRAVTAQAVQEDPTGDLRARARTEIRRLTDKRDALSKERDEIERLLPHRGEILGKLEEEERALGVDELLKRRALLVSQVRANLAVVAEMFSGMVSMWAGEFLSSLEAIDQFHSEVRSKGLERVEGLIGSPVDAVPTDVLRLVELLMDAAQIQPSNAGAGFVDACDLGAGDDLGGLVRETKVRWLNLGVEKTSWQSMHGEG